MKILNIWMRLAPSRRALLLQILRYGLVGLGVTTAQAVVYWILATLVHWHSQIANVAGYLVAVILGYVLHGRFSFRADAPLGSAEHGARGVRFVLVSLLSLSLNALWVWLCISFARWPTWTPIPAMLFVTPAIVFMLNRHWVFAGPGDPADRA